MPRMMQTNSCKGTVYVVKEKDSLYKIAKAHGVRVKDIMRQNPCLLYTSLRFTQLQKVLETYGYRMDAPRSGSSHYTFRKQGKSPITIPKHEPIKKVYVEMVRKVVESEERENENAE